ncbi:BON domain-containing protein [Ramlibacter humi]|nr:BON domain-containing protein [Ramlibacter humi]
MFRLSLLALAVTAALAACGDNLDQRTERVEDGVARAKGATAGARQEAREATAATGATPGDSTAVADANPGGAAPSTSTSEPATSAMGSGPDTRGAGTPAASSRAADAQITARVNQALAAENDLRGVRIDVDTQDGVVTLSGAVATAATRARITEVAKTVKDVRSVNDQLTLTTG